MDAAEIDALNEPGYATHEELKKLNQKVDQLSKQMALVIGHLQAIAINTRSPILRP